MVKKFFNINKLNIFITFVIILSFIFTPFFTDLLFANPGYLICLDPGHGGRDPGAVGVTGLMEKVVNLDIAYKVKSKLQAKGYSVVMTRTSDIYLSLDQRVAIANNKKATVFVSIHNNAFILPTPHGTETYYSSSGAHYGYYLADAIQQRVVANTGSINRGTKDGGFYVLNYTNMPAALQEGEFLSNPNKEALLKTDSFRNKIAQGIYEGIVNYLNKYGGGTTPSAGTYGATYADAGKTPASMEINKTYTIPITITNTGTMKWLKSGTTKVDLAYHWYDTTGKTIVWNGKRTYLLSDMTQGQKATLNAQVIAPPKAGTYILKYDLAHETITWFSQKNVSTLNKTVKVVSSTTPLSTAKYYATYADAGKTPASMQINKTYTIPITITNTGTMKWLKSGTTKVDLAYHWYDTTGKTIVWNGKRTYLLSDMAQGQKATLNAQVIAPPKAGTYILKYDLVHETITWFSQKNVSTLNKTVKVVSSTSTTNISNSTSIRGISSATKNQMLNMFKMYNTNKLDKASRIADLYIKWGNKFNIRADIAWAQMCHETNFLKYDGIVPESANNFCGLGATGPGVYLTFNTEELGVIAHYAHLAWYVYADHVNSYCSKNYDPRHSSSHNYNGNHTLNCLNGRWAPGSDYTYKIIKFANEIYN